jgi:hypothetical protein
MKFVKLTLLICIVLISIASEVESRKAHKSHHQSKHQSHKRKKTVAIETTEVYSNDQFKFTTANTSLKFDPAQWMSKVDTTKKLSELTIPGTHDTCATKTTSWAASTMSGSIVAQSNSITNQLTAGIRYLDIRASTDGKIYHGKFDIGQTFSGVLTECTTFLKKYPTEAIIMRIKNEKGDSNFATWFTGTAIKGNESYFLLSTTIPTLANAKGKIWPLIEFDGYTASFPWTNNSAIVLQDQYSLGSDLTIDQKMTIIQTAITTNQTGTDAAKLYINHSSASPAWLVGVDINDVAKKTNTVAKKNTGFMGIIIFDFPSQTLLNHVISQNTFTSKRRRLRRKY